MEEFAHRAWETDLAPALDAAALKACDALAVAGIDAVLMKGASLVRMLYRPGEHRGYVDVDLLVAPGDRARAGTVLAALGYANVTERYGADEMAGNLHAHHWILLTPGMANVMIDLHWQLPGCESSPTAVWTELSRHRITIELAGGRVPALDQTALALHLALHAAQHGPDDLKALGDLDRGLRRWPKEAWEQATRLAYQLHALEAFAAGLRLLPAGVARADELGLPQAEAQLWAIAHSDERPRGSFHLAAFSQAAGSRERIDVIRRALLPKRAWIAREYPWAGLSGPRLVAAYGVHLVRSPAWAARAWRFRRRGPRSRR